jgi:hypothetical protein
MTKQEVMNFIITVMEHDIDRFTDIQGDTKSSYQWELNSGKISQSKRVIDLMKQLKKS